MQVHEVWHFFSHSITNHESGNGRDRGGTTFDCEIVKIRLNLIMERKVIKTVQGVRTQDGAGVSLVRVLGSDTVHDFDPILMLDSFDSDDPQDYRGGFPTHPHRGIETISFLALGMMTHRDHLGNEATIDDGEAQWLTAGSGAFHSETLPGQGRMLGAQLWLNLPQKDKMCRPAYHTITRREIKEIPVYGGTVRLIAGTFKEHRGYRGKYLPLDYYDIHLNPHCSITIETEVNRSVMIFTMVGDVVAGGTKVREKTAAKLGEGGKVVIASGDEAVELLFISSMKRGEPVAWYGPIVMNSDDELRTAVRELNDGTFIKANTSYG